MSKKKKYVYTIVTSCEPSHSAYTSMEKALKVVIERYLRDHAPFDNNRILQIGTDDYWVDRLEVE